VNIPHTVRRAGAATMPATSAMNVSNPRALKHGRNAANNSVTDRGRFLV
jgi:hypothetical protein